MLGIKGNDEFNLKTIENRIREIWGNKLKDIVLKFGLLKQKLGKFQQTMKKMLGTIIMMDMRNFVLLKKVALKMWRK